MSDVQNLSKIEPDAVINAEHDGRTYVWKRWDPEKTGLTVLALENHRTGWSLCTTHSNPKVRVAAHKAWAGARHSRAPGHTADIMNEMGQKGVNPDEKLETTFKTYGHASVADMAEVDVHFNSVPMHVPFWIFNNQVINAGQEKSTRYQTEFDSARLESCAVYPGCEGLESEYQAFLGKAFSTFTHMRKTLGPRFTEFYRPESKKEENSLASRVLDTARFSLLFGQMTGFCTGTTARDWARTVAMLKASHLPQYNELGADLELLLAVPEEIEKGIGVLAEAPSLIRHTEPDTAARENVARLHRYLLNTSLLQDVKKESHFQGSREIAGDLVPRSYTEGDKLAAEYICSIWPGMNPHEVLHWASTRPQAVKRDISRIIFNGHSHTEELPVPMATRGMTVIYDCSMGEIRDFNRHRGQTRFAQAPSPLINGPMSRATFDEVLARGFGNALYLDVPEFAREKQEYVDMMSSFYDNLASFADRVEDKAGDMTVMMNLLPLGHMFPFWMHLDPKQAEYFTALRVRPGGHINYRTLAFDANQMICDSDPYLEGMRLHKRPDPADRQEFFNRS